jgi:hypothetical protein
MPVIAAIVMLALALLGVAFERVTAAARINAPAHRSRAREASFLGIKMAEDWLMTSALGNDFPAAQDAFGSVSLDRIEAVRMDGSRAEWHGGAVHNATVNVYVADVSYDKYLFGGELARKAGVPAIPRMPGVNSGDTVVRYYYLRSRASAGERSFFDSEEILAISHDKLRGETDVERILYRSSSGKN